MSVSVSDDNKVLSIGMDLDNIRDINIPNTITKIGIFSEDYETRPTKDELDRRMERLERFYTEKNDNNLFNNVEELEINLANFYINKDNLVNTFRFNAIPNVIRLYINIKNITIYKVDNHRSQDITNKDNAGDKELNNILRIFMKNLYDKVRNNNRTKTIIIDLSEIVKKSTLDDVLNTFTTIPDINFMRIIIEDFVVARGHYIEPERVDGELRWLYPKWYKLENEQELYKKHYDEINLNKIDMVFPVPFTYITLEFLGKLINDKNIMTIYVDMKNTHTILNLRTRKGYDKKEETYTENDLNEFIQTIRNEARVNTVIIDMSGNNVITNEINIKLEELINEKEYVCIKSIDVNDPKKSKIICKVGPRPELEALPSWFTFDIATPESGIWLILNLVGFILKLVTAPLWGLPYFGYKYYKSHRGGRDMDSMPNRTTSETIKNVLQNYVKYKEDKKHRKWRYTLAFLLNMVHFEVFYTTYIKLYNDCDLSKDLNTPENMSSIKANVANLNKNYKKFKASKNPLKKMKKMLSYAVLNVILNDKSSYKLYMLYAIFRVINHCKPQLKDKYDNYIREGIDKRFGLSKTIEKINTPDKLLSTLPSIRGLFSRITKSKPSF